MLFLSFFSWVSPFIVVFFVVLAVLGVDSSTTELSLQSSTVFFSSSSQGCIFPRSLLSYLLYSSLARCNPTKPTVPSVLQSVSSALTSPPPSLTTVYMSPGGVVGDSVGLPEGNVHHSFFLIPPPPPALMTIVLDYPLNFPHSIGWHEFCRGTLASVHSF